MQVQFTDLEIVFTLLLWLTGLALLYTLHLFRTTSFVGGNRTDAPSIIYACGAFPPLFSSFFFFDGATPTTHDFVLNSCRLHGAHRTVRGVSYVRPESTTSLRIYHRALSTASGVLNTSGLLAQALCTRMSTTGLLTGPTVVEFGGHRYLQHNFSYTRSSYQNNQRSTVVSKAVGFSNKFNHADPRVYAITTPAVRPQAAGYVLAVMQGHATTIPNYGLNISYYKALGPARLNKDTTPKKPGILCADRYLVNSTSYLAGRQKRLPYLSNWREAVGEQRFKYPQDG